MRRFAPLVLLLALLGGISISQDAIKPTTLAEANKLYDEKSYQLAIDQYGALIQEGKLSEPEKREAIYKRAMSMRHVGRVPESFEPLMQLAAPTAKDVWAGRAHWRLDPILGGHYGYPVASRMVPPNSFAFEDPAQGETLPQSEPEPLYHLKQADQILTPVKPADLKEFYWDVLQKTIPNYHTTNTETRKYLVGFYEKLIPLLKTEVEIAEAHLHRAVHAGYLEQKPVHEERLRLLRAVVTEFPQISAARRAQLQLAQHYMERRDLRSALKEYRFAADKWPATDEGKQAAIAAHEITAPQVDVSVTQTYLPGDVIRLLVVGRNTSSARISVIPFNPADLLRQQKQQRFDLAKVAGRPAYTVDVKLESRGDYMSTSAPLLLNFKERGAYVLRAEASTGKSNALLLITELALVSNTSRTALELWTAGAKDGKPRAGTEITVAGDYRQTKPFLGIGREEMQFHDIFTERTNDSGFLDVTKRYKDHGSQYFAVATDGQNNWAFIDTAHWYGHYNPQKQPKFYIYTDRTVYRPKQTVYWRAILRMQKEGKFEHSAGEKYRVNIWDPRGGRLVSDKEFSASEFGTITDKLELGEKPHLGEYRIDVMHSTGHSGQGTFRIEEYKKPEYEVSVRAAESLYKIGGKVKADVQANYYFGAPVTDATVKYTVRRRPRYIPYWEMQRYGSRDELDWFDEVPEERGAMHGSGGDIVATGSGKIADDGKFSLEFNADVPAHELRQAGGRYHHRHSWWPQAQAFDFQIEVTVTDKSRRNIDASQTIVVSEQALLIGAATQQHLYSPGDLVKVDLSSRNFSDDPVATSGTLYVERVRYLPPDGKEEITTLTTQRVDIGSSGSLIHEWRIPPETAGHLRFLLEVDDPFGKKIHAYGQFHVADEKSQDVFFKYQGMEIVADKTLYDVGETARVMILNEHKDASAWYWIDSGSGNLEKKILPLPQRTNFLHIPITDAFVPNSMIHLVVVRNKQIISDEKELIVPPKRKVLNVQLVPDKATYKPGDKARFDIFATDYKGLPVRGEFSMSVFDESILYIAPDRREDIRHAFYGTRRQLQSNIGSSVTAPGNYNGRSPQGTMNLLWYFDQLRKSPPIIGAIPDVIIGDAESSIATRDNNFFAFTDNFTFDASKSERKRMSRQLEMPAGAAGAPATLASEMAVAQDAATATGAAPARAPGAAKAPPMAAAKLRTDFRDSIHWSPAVVTDANGRGSIDVTYPDSLTTWKSVAVGTTAETVVGNATTTTLVQKNVLVRLQAPRFFRERDQVTLSGVVHNYLPTEQDVHVGIDVENLSLAATGATTESRVRVAAKGEARVDWTFDVKQSGEARIKMQALTSEESDAVEMRFPVLAHGIDKFVAWNGSSADTQSTSAQIQKSAGRTVITQPVEIPKERIISSSKLTVLVNPSLASVIRESLPFLIEYPYGCVEQTMSRFMPAVVAAQVFQQVNIPRDPAMDEKLKDVVAKGLDRLRDFQHSDGGWGWWRDDSSNPYMSAYVVYGLTLARKAGTEVEQSMLQRGIDFMRNHLRDFRKRDDKYTHWHYWRENDLHAMAYELFVLALNGETNEEALAYVWGKREELSAHGMALMARTMNHLRRPEEAKLMLRNMYNHAVITPENDTARWGRLNDAWYWWHDAVEATAHGLMAHLEIAPQDPMTNRSMKWLVLNRKGRQWKSTKDTAHAVLALASYIADRKESLTNMTVSVEVPGAPAKVFSITPDNFWQFDGSYVLHGDAVPDGKFPITITTEGNGTLFYNVFAEYFTLEEGIKKAGNEIYVDRVYERLVRKDVTGTTGTVAKDTYVPIADGETVASGEELRVTLKIKSLNDYEYIMFEDAKPAGMEPVALQSGASYGDGLCSNMELRDQYVSFFITHLPQGERTITYNCRAEIPGTFHTMPTVGSCMYFPQLRANSDEIVIGVKDAE